ncbi:TauD/TfdA family dioxygenase [Frankia sp. CNm7]|uniref:TauD/TfdA family dioxygenase n=2 Tax=Frankia nepalensis TaxID=1836974 RepID=A0A937UN79_9ACTN|nr:TauD/TfdA family dioxygenase [Frankia nepalensis]MBL7514708.1 TauD/TfdA family dioxygenase [Frankia nepalensis]MBL7520130.1 TauD/TfdA family dioxygenase [Frankia nepalensis]MBL7629594.1 TauD/TfdA family dioxygenase [Frankia nepalensis]
MPAGSTRAALDLEPVTPTLGARVRGIDLAADLPDEAIGAIGAALVAHKVLFFPGQRLDPDSQIAFARRFGELTSSHPVMAPLDDAHPQLWELEGQGGGRSDEWHTDVTFVRRPPLGSVLRAVRLPAHGGDTLWTDLQAAYDSLSAPVRRLVDELTALHDGSAEFSGYLAARGGEGNLWDGERIRSLAPVEHPVVRVHPVTGRRGLFVSPAFTTRIVGVSAAESRGILDLLFAHLTRPDIQIRHRWSDGDVAFWDNRSTAHYATFDYGDFNRLMHRVTIRGDEPVGPADPRAAA